jgi:hypothetical protein
MSRETEGDYEEEQLEPPEGPEIEAGPRRSLSLGFLAMLPLIVAYEWARGFAQEGRRNAAEALLSLILLPFGDYQRPVRWSLLALLALSAWAITRHRGSRARVGIARVFLEGLLAALFFGPLLVGLTSLAGDVWPPLDVSWDPTLDPPGLARAAIAMGGAVWEELAFRVGLYSLLFLVARRVLSRVTGGEGTSRWPAEAVALIGSAAAFAAFHFRELTDWLYPGGLAWDMASFTWMFLAGILLGVLFRWRGPGVAAWCHALFNLALLIGIDPDVLQ